MQGTDFISPIQQCILSIEMIKSARQNIIQYKITEDGFRLLLIISAKSLVFSIKNQVLTSRRLARLARALAGRLP